MVRPALPRIVGATAPPRGRINVPSSLKYPEFRNYWFALLASVTGYQMLVLFTLGWLISHELEGDARSLGYMSTAIAVPGILLNLLGGVFADKFSPKRLLGLTQSSTGMVVLGLAVLTMLDVVTQWHVLLAAFLIGAVQAFDNPTRQSMFPRLVGREALSSAVALNSAVWTGTRIIAPTMAGVLIGRTSIPTVIFLSAVGFLILSVVSQRLSLASAERATGRVFQEMAMGFTFIRTSPLFFLLIGMTFFNSMFGMSYVFLMPVFADEVLEIGPEKLGWLMGAAGVGALMGILIGANLGRSRFKGWLLIGGAFLFGVFLILFAFVSAYEQYEISMLVLFLGDLCISVYLIMVMMTLQELVPDQFRGRVMGFFTITWSLVPLGGLQASQIAHYISAPVAVGVGGAAVAAFALGVALGSRRVRDLGNPNVAYHEPIGLPADVKG